jgi:phage-related protein
LHFSVLVVEHHMHPVVVERKEKTENAGALCSPRTTAGALLPARFLSFNSGTWRLSSSRTFGP